MTTNSVALIRRGGLNKSNISAFAKHLLAGLIISLIFIGPGSFFFDLFRDSSGYELTDWEYIWVQSEDGSDGHSQERIKKNKNNTFKYRDGADYLLLSTELSGSSSFRLLSIKSANHLMDVRIDGETVLSQLGTGYNFSATPLLELMLEPSEEIQSVDIIMYAPATLDFSASVKDSETAKALLSVKNICGLVSGAFFVAFGLILLLISFSALRKTKYRTVFVLTGIVSVIFGMTIVFNQTGVPIGLFTHPGFFRLSVLFLMLLSLGLLIITSYALEIFKKMKWLLIISTFFTAAYIPSPLVGMELFIIRLFSVWSVICLIGFAFVIIQDGMPMSTGKRIMVVSYIAAILTQITYWVSYIRPFSTTGLKPYLLAAGINIIAAIFFFFGTAFVRKNSTNAASIVENETNLYEKYVRILAAKSDTNNNHLKNVSSYVRVMCEKMKMPPDLTNMIANAVILHDIGKLVVPKALLDKEDLITKEEYDQIRCHVLYGYNILTDPNDEFLQMAATIAKQHHERYDGSGYLGMKNGEIDIYAQITSIADTFDALTSYRAYKKAWSFNEACDYINKHSGDFFEPELVKVFNSCKQEFWEIYQHSTITDSIS